MPTPASTQYLRRTDPATGRTLALATNDPTILSSLRNACHYEPCTPEDYLDAILASTPAGDHAQIVPVMPLERFHRLRALESADREPARSRTQTLLAAIADRCRALNVATLTIAVDFDGTLHTGPFPTIGAPDRQLITLLIALRAAGHTLILSTCRTNIPSYCHHCPLSPSSPLSKPSDPSCNQICTEHAAITWCAQHGLIFDHINENNPARIRRYGSDTRKISADLYIGDDAHPWLAQAS